MDELDCSDNELATFVDKTITLRRHPTQEDINATTNTGIVRHINYKYLVNDYKIVLGGLRFYSD